MNTKKKLLWMACGAVVAGIGMAVKELITEGFIEAILEDMEDDDDSCSCGPDCRCKNCDRAADLDDDVFADDDDASDAKAADVKKPEAEKSKEEVVPESELVEEAAATSDGDVVENEKDM